MSIEPLSHAELRRRLTQIQRESEHLAQRLPPDNLHNAVLRLRDVARYIGVRPLWLYYVMRGARPEDTFSERMQKDLSRFFWGWDNGNLIKARVGNEWQILNRAGMAKMAPPPGSAVLVCRIDVDRLGMTVRRAP